MRIFFVSAERVVPYKPKEHVNDMRDFLYWKQANNNEPLLIVGNGEYTKKDNLLECFKKHGYDVPATKINGVGYKFPGEPISWKSWEFGVITPENICNELKEALGLKYQCVYI